METSFDQGSMETLTSLLIDILNKIKSAVNDTQDYRIAHALLQTSEQSCKTLIEGLKSGIKRNDFIQEYDHLRSTITRAREEVTRLDSQAAKKNFQRLYHLVERLSDELNGNERTEAVREFRASELAKKLEYLEAQVLSYQNTVKELQDKSKIELVELDKFIEETKSRLNEKEDEVNEVIGRTTEKAIAGNYEMTALKESKTADIMRRGSLAFMTLMILVTAFTYYRSFSEDMDLVSVLIKMSIVAILSIPAGYLAKESTRHRSQQHKYEQMSLHLKAASPYVENLPENIKNEIKIRLADQIFSQSSHGPISEESFRPGSEVLLKKILEQLKKESK